jgi:hypothetical protein
VAKLKSKVHRRSLQETMHIFQAHCCHCSARVNRTRMSEQYSNPFRACLATVLCYCPSRFLCAAFDLRHRSQPSVKGELLRVERRTLDPEVPDSTVVRSLLPRPTKPVTPRGKLIGTSLDFRLKMRIVRSPCNCVTISVRSIIRSDRCRSSP